MLLIGLLLVALVCLVVGLILANGAFLIASLVASAVAGYVLWRERKQITAKTGVHKDQAPPKTTPESSLVTGTAFKPNPDSAANAEQKVWVVDGQPQFHTEKCAAIQNLDAEAIPL